MKLLDYSLLALFALIIALCYGTGNSLLAGALVGLMYSVAFWRGRETK